MLGFCVLSMEDFHFLTHDYLIFLFFNLCIGSLFLSLHYLNVASSIFYLFSVFHFPSLSVHVLMNFWDRGQSILLKCSSVSGSNSFSDTHLSSTFLLYVSFLPFCCTSFLDDSFLFTISPSSNGERILSRSAFFWRIILVRYGHSWQL